MPFLSAVRANTHRRQMTPHAIELTSAELVIAQPRCPLRAFGAAACKCPTISADNSNSLRGSITPQQSARRPLT